MPFRGNVGVRYVKTDQSASGFTLVAGAPVAITATRDYSNSLPSLDMSLEPFQHFLVRFAAAKVMARPNLGSLTPSVSVTVSGSSHSVTAGNPNLNPLSPGGSIGCRLANCDAKLRLGSIEPAEQFT